MKFSVLSIVGALMLGASASTAQSQNIYSDMASGIAKMGVAEAERMLDQAPSLLSDALQKAERGQAYETAAYCRGALQTVVNIGAIVANITPFSTVWTLEDNRGPVGKLRIMLNGEQIHTEIYCRGNLMMASTLDWGVGSEVPREVGMNSFSALAGAMLIMKLQGAFDEVADVVGAVEEIDAELSTRIEPANEVAHNAEEAVDRELLDPPVAEFAERLQVTLTEEQRQRIAEAVSRNWNKSIIIGKVNFEQLVIVLEVGIAPNGAIVAGSIKPVAPSNPIGDFKIAYDAARRAVLRAEVIPLPYEVYLEEIKLTFTFDPTLKVASLN